MKFLLGFLSAVLVLVVLVVLVAGYFGFVPGVSSLFGSNKPRDLGVSYAASDYQSARTKGDIDRVDLPAGTTPSNSLDFSGQHPASFSLSNAEATSLVGEKTWLYFPVRDAQIRFNADGTAEFSGILMIDRLKDFTAAMGVTDEEYNTALDWVGRMTILQNNLPFYIKGSGSVTNGVIAFQTDEINLGRVKIPVDRINENKSQGISLVQELIARIPGFSVRNFSISGGRMNFDGTLPDRVSRAVAK